MSRKKDLGLVDGVASLKPLLGVGVQGLGFRAERNVHANSMQHLISTIMLRVLGFRV